MRAVFRHYSHRYNTHQQTSSSALSSEHSTPFIRQQTTTAGKAEPPALAQQVGVASSSSLRPPVTAYSDHPNRKQDGFGRPLRCAVFLAIFSPRDAMRKRGFCCRPVSVRPSVYCNFKTGSYTGSVVLTRDPTRPGQNR